MKTMPNTFSFKALFASTLLLSSFVTTTVTTTAQAQEQSQTEESISQGELEQILAPIALYPDTILSHILVASTYPLEVVQAERWSAQHPDLQGQDAVEAAQENDWDPSIQALTAFPQILKRMSQDLDWTQRLGDAFLENEAQVLASVQNLRVMAEQSGSLAEMDKVTVTHEERTIIIEPREREVVYVPYYDTRVVYGSWRWAHYQPTYWDYPYYNGIYYSDYYSRNRSSAFYWGPRVSLSFGFFSNSFNWRNHYLVRISSQNYRPKRYYNHSEIRDHRYAQRWVHDDNRRHVSRRKFNNDRAFQSQGYERVGREGRHIQRGQLQQGQLQRGQVRQQPSQAQVKGQLGQLRSTTTSRPVRSPAVDRSERARVIEGNRRVPNRPQTQPAVRQAQIQAKGQLSQSTAPTQQQARVVPQQARVAPQQKAVSRPVTRSTPAATQRDSAPQRTQTTNRNMKMQRQPR